MGWGEFGGGVEDCQVLNLEEWLVVRLYNEAKPEIATIRSLYIAMLNGLVTQVAPPFNFHVYLLLRDRCAL